MREKSKKARAEVVPKSKRSQSRPASKTKARDEGGSVREITLCHLRGGGTEVWVGVEVNDQHLRFSGHDIGEAPERFFGRDDHEYWLTVERQYFGALILALISEAYRNDAQVISKMQALLDRHKIPSEFASY